MEKSLKFIVEAALFAADRPLNLEQLQILFSEDEKPTRSEMAEALMELQREYANRSVELIEVASGYRFQVRSEFMTWVSRLEPERSPRYSRALLETLVLIAYKQPITRKEIEQIRGVNISSAIIKNLLEYQWIRILAHRNTPGHPALYGTTRHFLDYFNLKSLNGLPTLAEIKDMGNLLSFNDMN
jgi:segregation and condensation protein B